MIVSADRQLVDAVLAGDSDAFRILVERESRAVVGSCHRILRDPLEAQDVAQDAFLSAYRALATFRGDGSFGAWVGRIAVRAAVARLATRRDTIQLDDEMAERWAMAIVPSDDPESRALDRDRHRMILEAVAALPEAQRDVIVLHFYRDLALQEIAEITGRPVGTVKSRLNRGMAALRDRLVSRAAL